MKGLIHEFLFDLRQRCANLLADLRSTEAALPPEIVPYQQSMVSRLERTVQIIERLLADPQIQSPRYARHFFREYKRLAEFVFQLEAAPVLALKHFGAGDRLLTRLVSHICSEIGFAGAPPVCSSLSSSYFWAIPNMDLVFVPCAEPYHLLSLPDLYHELAHFVIERNRRAFLAALIPVIKRHFQQAVTMATQARWPPDSIEQLKSFEQAWERHYWVEFASDMIATFCVGPAFGWTNVRLCTNSRGELYEPGEVHPADDARAVGISCVLNEIGQGAPASAIDQRWRELARLTGQPRPQSYDLCFPSVLIEEFASEVISLCHLLGLHSFPQTPTPAIGMLLNQAWDDFFSSPEDFAAFEREQLAKLQKDFGL